jgi:hypothetical protein
MTNAFVTHQSSRHLDVADKHQASIAATLAHRLAKARDAQNQQLIALLEHEQRQLARQQPVTEFIFSTAAQWVETLRQRLVSAIAQPAALSVEQIVGDSGAILWRAYDPTTGETRYAESDAEIVDWIENSRARGMAPGILGLWGWQDSAFRQPPTR